MLKKVESLTRTILQISKEKISSNTALKSNDVEINAHVKNLINSGISVIENYYTPEECKIITDSIDNSLIKYPGFVWRDQENSDHRLFGSENTNQLIKKFHTDKKILEIGRYFTGIDIADYTTLAAKLEFNKNNLGSGGGWHRDTAIESKQFKAIVYLQDVDRFMGPFQYITGTHRQSSLLTNIINTGLGYAHNRITEDEVNKILNIKSYSLKNYTAKAGTVILANTFGIHRGMPILKGNRYALTNYYYSKSTIESEKEKLMKKFNPVPFRNE